MRPIKRIVCLLVIAALFLSAAACGDDPKAPYRTVGDELYEESLTMAFRAEDPLRQIVTAALQELAASGEVAALSEKWLEGRELPIQENASALAALRAEVDIPAERTFIMGYAAGAVPRVVEAGESLTGFDIELARLVCLKLGWRLRLQPITAESANIELYSGNIDCAWGFALSDPDLSITAPYLETEYVFAVGKDSEVKRFKQLEDKLLYVPSEAALAAVEEDPGVKNTVATPIRTAEGAQACLDALDKGSCDVILIDRLALEYACR